MLLYIGGGGFPLVRTSLLSTLSSGCSIAAPATPGLIKDVDEANKQGIYPYLLTRDERILSIRVFTDNIFNCRKWKPTISRHGAEVAWPST